MVIEPVAGYNIESVSTVRASLPVGWYQIILLGKTEACE